MIMRRERFFSLLRVAVQVNPGVNPSKVKKELFSKPPQGLMLLNSIHNGPGLNLTQFHQKDPHWTAALATIDVAHGRDASHLVKQPLSGHFTLWQDLVQCQKMAPKLNQPSLWGSTALSSTNSSVLISKVDKIHSLLLLYWWGPAISWELFFVLQNTNSVPYRVQCNSKQHLKSFFYVMKCAFEPILCPLHSWHLPSCASNSRTKKELLILTWWDYSYPRSHKFGGANASNSIGAFFWSLK